MEAAMQDPVPSTIAQVLFEPSSTLNYARIVAELEAVLSQLKPEGLRTSWDCDDLVFFDLVDTRIGLGFSEFKSAPIASCLTVSVGPRHAARVAPDAGFDVLCSRIVERLQSRYLPLAVLWNQTSEEISADLIDRMTDALPGLTEALPPIDGILDPLWRTAQEAAAASGLTRMIPEAEMAHQPPSPFATPDRLPHAPVHPRALAQTLARAPAQTTQRPAVALAANDMSPAVMRHAPDLIRTRAALYEDEELADQKMSTQMRLAVHCLNATLIMVWMPFGAAVMTYSIMKGEDMRFSGRIMALTGCFLAIAHSPFGHSVAAAVAGTVAGA
jgi:hypothetical protein